MREELDYQREAKHVALYRVDAGRHRSRPRAAVWPKLSTGRLLTLDWLEGTKLLDPQGRRARRPQPHRTGDVHRLVVPVQPLRRDPRRSASRQLHRVRRKAARPAASTCSTMAASASSRRSSSAAWSISITGCRGTTTIWWSTPTRPGASRASRARLIDTLNIWAQVHLRPAARRPRAHHRRRRQAVRIRPPRSLPGPSGPEEAGPVRCRASSCSWTAPRSGSAPCSCTSRAAEFLPAVQRGDREFLAGRGRAAPGGGARQGRPDRGVGRLERFQLIEMRSAGGCSRRCPCAQLRLIPGKKHSAENRDGRPRRGRIRDRGRQRLCRA